MATIPASNSSTTEYCLRWINYEPNAAQFFSNIHQNDTLADVTLVSHEGKQIRAHKLVLSACSNYFLGIFENTASSNGQVVIVLKDISFVDLQAVVCFIYKGVVNVPHERINSVLLAATSLQVKGLSSNSNGTPPNSNGSSYSTPQQQQQRAESVRGGSTAAMTKPDILSTPPPPETLVQATPPPPQPRKRSRTTDSANKSEQRSGQAKKSDSSSILKKEEETTPSTFQSNASNEFTGSRLHNALLQGGSTAKDEFHNLDFGASLRNVKMEEEFPDDLCEVAFHEGSDDAELLTFDDDTSLADLLLPSTSTSAQAAYLSNNELGMQQPSLCLDNSPLNTDGTSSVDGDKDSKSTTNSAPGSKKARKGNRRFKCETCGAEYTCLSHMIRHSAVHADPRFQCEFCQRCFTRKDVLTRHLKEVHYSLKCRNRK